MAIVTDRTKKKFRKKFKKKIDRSTIRKLWKDWVDIMILEPLIEKGEVMLDKRCKLEVVGVPIHMKKGIKSLASKGMSPMKEPRKGWIYDIRMIEPRFKSLLMFDANKKFKKALIDKLENTHKHYRREHVN
nr:hypothetical protein [uncultured Flavobacterium sp.]